MTRRKANNPPIIFVIWVKPMTSTQTWIQPDDEMSDHEKKFRRTNQHKNGTPFQFFQVAHTTGVLK